MKIIATIKKYLHTCNHNKLIVSMYWSFSTRKCIYECKCGHRIVIDQRHDWIFPHPTADMITYSEFKSYLTMSPVKTDYNWSAYGFNVAYGRKTWQWLYEIADKEIWINISGIDEFKAKYPNSKYRQVYI